MSSASTGALRGRRLWGGLLLAAAACAVSDGAPPPTGTAAGEAQSSGMLPWIDTHAHPTGIESTCLTADCVASVIATMDAYAIRKTIFMHPPARSGGGNPATESAVEATVALRPDRLFYGAGGNLVNALLQQTPDSGEVPSELTDSLVSTVEELLADGNVVCLGELAALHLSYAENHSFEETLPNTPLFERLAELAASHDVAIDLHMDAVERTMPTPSYFTSLSSQNPTQIQGNIDPLEQLLAHVPNAKIVWAHVGRDTTGDMSAPLVARLLAAHPNLYVQIHPVFGPLQSPTAIVDQSGTIRSEWSELLQTYPDRAVLGTDAFYDGGDEDALQATYMQDFLQQLPPALAYRLGCQNPVVIYGLPSGC